MDFNGSLLREKFTIIEENAEKKLRLQTPISAMSNRIKLSLKESYSPDTEDWIVRSHTMHSCLRMAARLIDTFEKKGYISRLKDDKLLWKDLWRDISRYENTVNPENWVAIYYKGKIVFEDGAHHPFLDIIEMCDAQHKGDYESSLKVAESAFQQAGSSVKINYDSNIAMIVSTLPPHSAKCGVILRGSHRNTTFNFSVSQLKSNNKKDIKLIETADILSTAAAFLEGIQLAFMIGSVEEKKHHELIEKTDPLLEKSTSGSTRLQKLNQAITKYEQLVNIKYLPERPDFKTLLDESRAAQKAQCLAILKQKAIQDETAAK